jgi:hypothetical protein
MTYPVSMKDVKTALPIEGEEILFKDCLNAGRSRLGRKDKAAMRMGNQPGLDLTRRRSAGKGPRGAGEGSWATGTPVSLGAKGLLTLTQFWSKNC